MLFCFMIIYDVHVPFIYGAMFLIRFIDFISKLGYFTQPEY